MVHALSLSICYGSMLSSLCFNTIQSQILINTDVNDFYRTLDEKKNMSFDTFFFLSKEDIFLSEVVC